ncbi:MAG: fimbrillin family protein [Alistipes sp.]|nr:fimbrillin family protein [Alistipes sp.]
MKKILFAAVALIAFAACTNDYVVNKDKGSAIAFDKAFVENSTRAADYTANNIADFGVYGFITNNSGEGKIFNNQLVTKSGDAYVYSPAQYWVGGATYSFSALVPYTDRQWAYAATDSENGVISFDNAAAEANQDLLFAFAQKTTPASITSAPEAVAFTFNHLLSRVKFSFTNGFGEGQNIELKVSDVHVTDAYAEGSIALVDGVLEQAWTPANNTLDVDFGDAGDVLGVNAKGTTEHFYLIPAVEATYNVTFTIDIIQAGVLVDTYNRTATVTLGMERGKSYDLQALLTYQNTSDDGTLYPIEFTVNKVEDWAEFGEAEVTVPQHEVATAAEFAAAVAEGGNIVLTQDINLDAIASTLATRAAAGYGLQITKDCVIDGAGHTLSSKKMRAMAVCDGATNVTFKNFTLNAGGERGIQIEGNAKNVVIENVTAVSANYTVNLPSSASNANVTIKDCDLKGLCVINVWGENAVVNIENTVLHCEDNAATEGYAVVSNNGVNAVVNVNGGEVIIDGTAPEDTEAGGLNAEGAQVNFNGTKGNCYVEGHNFAINYGDYRYTFATFEAAYKKAVEGETIVVTRNVTLDNAIKVKKTITLDLNGKTLKTTKEDEPVIWVSTDGQLTINGEGTVIAEDSDAVYAASTGKLVINGGNYFSPVSTVYAAGSAEVVINGGTHQVEGEWGQTYTLNLKGNTNASIVVNGGSYYKYDPRNSSSESPMANFVAEGKTVEQEGDWYIVK